MKTLIFDFDGTLADSFELIVDVTYELTGARRLPAEGIEALRGQPILAAVPRLGMKWWYIPKLLLMTRPRMYKRMHTVKLFPGVAEAIRQLNEAGHHLLVMSSNREQNVRACLRAHHLEHYFDGIYNGNVFHKAGGLKRILRRNKLEPNEVYYIGNEPLDVRAANKAGVHAIAVTWSGQDPKRLVAAGQAILVRYPNELTNAVK